MVSGFKDPLDIKHLQQAASAFTSCVITRRWKRHAGRYHRLASESSKIFDVKRTGSYRWWGWGRSAGSRRTAGHCETRWSAWLCIEHSRFCFLKRSGEEALSSTSISLHLKFQWDRNIEVFSYWSRGAPGQLRAPLSMCRRGEAASHGWCALRHLGW